ncbi:MAG: decaprenylphospho-beta-D-erythro-pentofuranosid-2-ulose 2-reductase [Corynebacterium sp.]|uniref:decaprenylphospho-beta-D-erythro-pentofuranosid- 2-ulose 2-reductase n=1 Tax=Corynebacterium TaxID=1716 RepID=UPI002647969B|nr:decaprenylphospho-beta-D-erythro-pentofuranosid-2-ulose 2-reductase [Corynebacterium sp.]MDN5722871.1 decaprenylphospho-beta-D-erythro-pentofuranosid-2-ulose 2-reductase [Corynebacterium sp.]MDN6282353.1 decaprenylphospho-beta-D-erythro-pentofuranosid-2-ulose 2-reductase [Corynebacterium sp.]MDN6305284.1 decaprenylphospho-beta-D-erythro-pentofuranosid-2-ulose 2-reductase [Corynebacterium sp.]MDN6366592.1 decaprenylphospho-beta-D-erythro-pentofuranosid-2-ulose 2-reductase [Corynebacterium sp.
MINAVGKPQSILLLGGASDMGLAVVEEFLTRGPARVVLAARGGEDLSPAIERMESAGASTVDTIDFDATDFDSHEDVFNHIWAKGDIDLAIVAFGVLGDNEEQWTDQKKAVLAAQVNYTGAVSVGVLLADRMKQQGHGQIVVFSSVAGEMVRRSNFVYGSTKAGTDGFYRMLGEALRGTGVRVLTVRPGQVRTNMTQGLDDAPLTVDKSDAAKAVVAGVDGKKAVIWIHPLFRWIMLILKNLPQFVVRRLPL